MSGNTRTQVKHGQRMAPLSRCGFPFVFTWASCFYYCHLSFQISKNTRTQKDLKSQPLAMHSPSNGTGFYFFSRMNQKPSIWGRYLNLIRFCADPSLHSVLIYPGQLSFTFSNGEYRFRSRRALI